MQRNRGVILIGNCRIWERGREKMIFDGVIGFCGSVTSLGWLSVVNFGGLGHEKPKRRLNSFQSLFYKFFYLSVTLCDLYNYIDKKF